MSGAPEPEARGPIEPVAWGRSHAEYLAMFALDRLTPAERVLDVAAGPASFTAERHARGGAVTACDPLYARDRDAIAAGIEVAGESVMALVREQKDRFVWQRIADPEDMERQRRAAMDRFLADFDAGRAAGRYRPDALPSLALADGAFDLVLCSHFLFLYSARFDLAFHEAALLEMLRVGREARVFPLLDMEGVPSPHVAPLIARLRALGLHTARTRVAYEFQRGGNEMLQVWHSS